MSEPLVTVITGASSGIGAATARRAAAAGHQLVLASRSADRLTKIAREVGGLAVVTDVSEWSDNEALMRRAVDEFGHVDVVFANAGIGAKRGWLDGETPEHWREMVLTNVLGAAYTARAALPVLRERHGHLLLTSSAAGRVVRPGSLYSCTKHAVSAMVDALRNDPDGSGIRITVIEPGRVNTPFFDSPPEDALEADDIARAVMFAVEQPPGVAVNEILIRPAI
jgi:NADP-dependent 3-hydroxy acid dehydrogenase YdfG